MININRYNLQNFFVSLIIFKSGKGSLDSKMLENHCIRKQCAWGGVKMAEYKRTLPLSPPTSTARSTSNCSEHLENRSEN